MTTPDRHVSRWRLPATSPRDDAPSSASGAAPAVSLRYLDEFVRKLQCAPRLLEHEIFPDAKEITESMGLFNAVRRYVLPSDKDDHAAGDGHGLEGDERGHALADGIVVVGDGNTPRSAAMFAYRLKQWTCYSIDPAMERASGAAATARARGWADISNLVVVSNKIENVHIKLRRAVVALVHAHVTLAQALGAVECDELVGVVTMPCCNWYGKQEQLEGRAPSVVYDDFSILSDHRELRVWVDPRGYRAAASEAGPLALDQSAVMAKGCVRKEFVADVAERDPIGGADDAVASSGDTKTQKKKSKPAQRAAALVQELLSSRNVASDADSRSSGRIASTAQSEAVAAHVATLVAEPATARVLVLSGDGAAHSGDVARELLQRGFTNVFALQSSTRETANEDDRETLHAQVVKLDIAASDGSTTPSIIAELVSIVRTTEKPECSHTYATRLVDPKTQSQPLALFDCIVDMGLIHRSLRNQPKKTCGDTFERVVSLVLSMTKQAVATAESATPRLISVSPRKDWRKREFLANDRLALIVATTTIPVDNIPASTALYVYACSPSASTVTGHDHDGAKQTQKNEKKQLALQLKRALEVDFAAHARGLPMSSLPDVLALGLAAEEDTSSSQDRLVRVQGAVQHLRRFTTGPSFFSIASTATATTFRDHFQVALDPLRLARWSGATSGLSPDAVLRLLHKGDRVECVGVVAQNAQQQPVLRLDALRFLESEFQAYQ